MKLSISQATDLSNKILQSFGFTDEEAKFTTENLIEGELTGKLTHGLVRIPWIKKNIDSGSISINSDEISIEKETPVSILINGKGKTGFYVVNKALELGMEKVSNSGMVGVGTTNTAASSGLIGLYARKAAERDMILIGFNNSPGGLYPYGSLSDMFGTNPFTVGIPSNNTPVILDMASSNITWGDLLVAKSKGITIPKNSALDENGEETQDPEEAMKGGLLPFGGHKGSGLGMIVELLGGALTGSRVGYNIDGGWGSFFILINPELFRDLADFKSDVDSLINEMKTSKKMKGYEEVYFPGEQSQKNRAQALEAGEIEVRDELVEELKNYI